MAELGRVRCITEAQNSLLVWALGIAWGVLSVLSTLSLLFPEIAHYIPRWPWYVYVIGFLVVAVVAIFEGAFRQAQELRSFVGGAEVNHKTQKQAAVLATLVTHHR